MSNFPRSLDKKKGRTLVPSPPAPSPPPAPEEPEVPPPSENDE